MDHKASEVIEAVVSSVDSRKGKEYVVVRLTGSSPHSADLQEGTTVTFSLSKWSGKHPPKNGQLVILEDIEKFAKGWRARTAKPIQARK